ncbi:hypothetical protein JKF63_05033 [Porcisia hertigi]|uniref:Uncharacterized protein n=1 Tax=Porcisia hertigi TaxID=2761500 RepID=A0A836IPR8_9TRYP|nr:hypothetical protein JKF63_05033 [Porcisia hertigi]
MFLRRTTPAATSTRALAGHVCDSPFTVRRRIFTLTSALSPSLDHRLSSSVPSSSRVSPSQAVTPLHTPRRHTATSTTTDSLASDDVPNDVTRRVTGNKQEMLRLLRLAAGHGAVPVAKIEEVFGKHLGFLETKVASAEGGRPLLPTSSLWRSTVWQTLRLHCYFTWIVAEGGSGCNTKGRVRGVVPLDWASVLDHVASRIPYEGWSEPELHACLRGGWPILARYTPAWSTQYSGVDSFAQFVHRHFSRTVTMTRSAVTGEALYHRTGHNSVSVTWRALPDGSSQPQALSGATDGYSACAAVQHALHILGRGHQLPVWTDVDEVAPLLLNNSGLADGRPCTWQETFAKDPELRGAFHLESYVRVRATESHQRLLAIVDCTSLSAADLGALLKQHPMRGGDVTIKLLIRAGIAPESHEAYARTCIEAAGPSALVEDVLVDALLGPEHLLAALLETVAAGRAHNEASPAAAAQPAEGSSVEDGESPKSKGGSGPMSSTQMPVVLFCGTASREAFTAVLEEVRSPEGGPYTLFTHPPTP